MALVPSRGSPQALPLSKTEADVQELISRQLTSRNADGDPDATARLVEHIRRGNGGIVLEAIRQNFKYNPPATQLRMLCVMDQCLIQSGPQFAVMLSSDKWTDRLFKVAKTTTTAEVRDKILVTVLAWYQRFHTNGHQRLLQRFQQSRTLSEPFQRVSARVAKNQQQRSARHPHLNFASLDSANRNDILDLEETILLECQGDLASLEYALEHPHVLPDNEIANECKEHKIMCMRMLESGEHERISAELMTLIERFSEALCLFEAMTGVDVGEGEGAKMRAVADEDLAEADSDDDDEQRRLRQRNGGARRVGAGNRADAAAVMKQAQQETENLVIQERNETLNLRSQLEDLRQKHEELQNKYKDAKMKNREAVGLLEQYAERVELLERGVNGAGSGLAPLPVLGAGSLGAAGAAGTTSSASPSVVANMRSCLASVRKSLREVKEVRCRDMMKETLYYTAQISNAMAAMIRAGDVDREADRKALLWTQELYKREMKLRKQYYNTIQELKGNIRVYCRVRPMLPKEIQGGYTDVMSYPSPDSVKFIDPSGRPKLFEFDEVYPPTVTQARVFEDTSPLIDSVVDGYNVCIFAYGQTGSGKTFTMNGSEGENKGINTRALERLFEIIEERKETETSSVTVSVLEIYCEQIRDLLATKKEAAGMTYEVKQGGPFGTYVTNLKEIPVTSPGEISGIMATAQTHRSEGTTNMNEHSSRSHMLLYIIVRTTNKQTNMQGYGKLSLIDLAGSERLDKSGAEGQRLKEAVAINKSLSALGDVIAGLAQSSKHVPFRNSALTFLLQDSMAGQAKVLMFVCVSPASYNASESGSSLLFASRARGVAFGQIKKNATTEKAS
ncbi:hypothetical protein CUR178_06387 [Leishmania enriettii]|uniref:Kinesin-like protein n=1 Tax=Leishmania enriettii TaxID=5663 RepID=A0A836HBN4_LEIEN|nr:hypothetical protein CUR178_06387 [Leishmania enriettii]